MKRLLTSRILTCLIFLTIWGSKTYAQGSISSYTAGTETFEITSNTKIPKQSTEYQYYASANISLFIGADEVWKNEEIFSGNIISVLAEIWALNKIKIKINKQMPVIIKQKKLRVTQLVSPCQTQVTISTFCSTPKVRSNLPLMQNTN